MDSKDLPVPYHQQDTDYYCGAACAQMVLDSVGAGLLDQVGLYNDNHSHSTSESGWATAPDGLQWTLNNLQGSKYFCLDALSSEDAISRMIAWTIHHYGVAPVALVYGWAHWIVVRGYTTSDPPSSSLDTSYTISSFDVNNPWPPTPTPAPPPPHADPDVCGSGGMRGVADEHISYSAWQSTYMTGVPSGYWSGKFVAVCDPSPPPDFGPRPERRVPQRTFVLIDAEQARDAAMRALDTHGLMERERWQEAFGRGLGRPQLVERLDRIDEFYYIAPTEGVEGTIGLVAIDAHGGAYLQSAVLRARERVITPYWHEAELLDHVLRTPQDLAGNVGRLVVRPGLVCIYPHLVWEPCRESLSPFYPFRMIIVGAHRIFVRVADGAVFTSLTTGLRGI